MQYRPSKSLSSRFKLEADPKQLPFMRRAFRLNSMLLFDQYNGLGATCVNRSVGSKASVAFMSPDMFLSLASPGVVHDSKEYIAKGLQRYRDTDLFPLASPFLMINIKEAWPRVVMHEGRNRMRAIRELGAADQVPVVLYPTDGVMDKEQTQRVMNGMKSELGEFIEGPLFTKAVVNREGFRLKPPRRDRYPGL